MTLQIGMFLTVLFLLLFYYVTYAEFLEHELQPWYITRTYSALPLLIACIFQALTFAP